MARNHDWLVARPCNIVSAEDLWCVCGGDPDGNSGGVIDWCYDEIDARDRARMWAAAGYRGVSYRKYDDER